MSSQNDNFNNHNETEDDKDRRQLVNPPNYRWNSSVTSVVEVITSGVATGISCCQMYYRITGFSLPNRTIGLVTAVTTTIFIYLRDQNMLTARNVRNISMSTSLVSLLFELNEYIQNASGKAIAEDTQVNREALPNGPAETDNVMRRLIVRLTGKENGAPERKVFYIKGKLHSQEVADASEEIQKRLSNNGISELAPSTAIIVSNESEILMGDTIQSTNTVGIDGQVAPPPVNISSSVQPGVTHVPENFSDTVAMKSITDHVVNLSTDNSISNIIENREATLSTLQIIDEQVSNMIDTNPTMSMGSPRQTGGNASDKPNIFDFW